MNDVETQAMQHGYLSRFITASGGMNPELDVERKLEKDVEGLLSIFRSFRNSTPAVLMRQIKVYLSCFYNENVSVRGLTRTDALVHLRNVLASVSIASSNTKMAANTYTNLLDTLPYPIVLLVEACGRTTNTPASFYSDSFLACLSSLHHKNFRTKTRNYETKARFWSMCVAVVGVGKSPGLDPMLAALKEVMRENPTHCIGKEHDDYHMARGIVSHANSTTKLDDCDGYQFICNGEAGGRLCTRWAGKSGEWDKQCINIPGQYLDAAHGGPVLWETKI